MYTYMLMMRMMVRGEKGLCFIWVEWDRVRINEKLFWESITVFRLELDISRARQFEFWNVSLYKLYFC